MTYCSLTRSTKASTATSGHSCYSAVLVLFLCNMSCFCDTARGQAAQSALHRSCSQRRHGVLSLNQGPADHGKCTAGISSADRTTQNGEPASSLVEAIERKIIASRGGRLYALYAMYASARYFFVMKTMTQYNKIQQSK